MSDLPHAQRMQQKERELWAQVSTILPTVLKPEPPGQPVETPTAPISGVVTTTADEQAAIRRFLKGLA